MIDTKELRRQVEHEIACGAKAKNMDLPVLLSILDRLERAEVDAERYRWLCDGNGYFMEEEMLCGHANEKDKADRAIDKAMAITRSPSEKPE